jgi:dienelactone hydrolase
VHSDGWELIGDLQIPETPEQAPAVLLLNKADGNRHVYREMAEHLTVRGIASLRLDMRGHGDSTNLDQFVPNESDEATEIMIWDSEADVVAAHEFLESHPKIDADRIAIVGASYSGEEMAEAGRIGKFAQAYVALSPGSFSEESVAAMDESGVPWLFIVSRHERYLTEIAASVQSSTRSVEIVYIPGDAHATRILESREDVAERVAVWLASKL